MKNLPLKILTAGSYLLMIVVNSLANTLPINNRSTGEISDAYPNLFAPAGITFSIWGIIYLLLAGYVLYQFTPTSKKVTTLMNKINPLFVATSIVNVLWILAWHYDFIGLSLILMVALLILLISTADMLRTSHFTPIEKLLIYSPFSVYFGWITVATIANVTIWLVSINWNGFGIPDYAWTSIILLVGAAIGILRMNKDKNTLYGSVFIWAYLGIFLKHVSQNGFAGQYPSIMYTILFCLILFVFFMGKLFYTKQRRV